MTATIWRAKCEHRDVRITDACQPPAGRGPDGLPLWAPCMLCSAKWHRYEVTEERLWRIKDDIDDGAILHFFETRKAADEALCTVVSADLRMRLSAPVLVTRRLIRRDR